MGDAAEAALNYEMRGMYEPRRQNRKTFQRGSGNYKWRSSKGIISMEDMSIRHLSNAINICEANGNTGKGDQLREVLEIREAEQAVDLYDPDSDLTLDDIIKNHQMAVD